MANIIKINNNPIQIKEYNGQRVVTFKDIDLVHNRPEGTAGRNFRENRNRFIENVDYFNVKLTDDEIRRQFGAGKNASAITLITESGYLMLVKSFNDDLAWEVQRQLINIYFRTKVTRSIPDVKQKEIEARLRNAKARQANILLKIASNPDIPSTYRQVLQSYAAWITTGKKIIPLSEVKQKTYTAEEIGEMLNISANMVGRIANKIELKTPEYGEYVWDKAKHVDKQVATFRYYENAVEKIREHLKLHTAQ